MRVFAAPLLMLLLVNQASAACIIGTDRADMLEGTGAAECIKGLGGNDRISARGGNDVVDGGSGYDLMTGGGGKDIFKVNSGTISCIPEACNGSWSSDKIRDYESGDVIDVPNDPGVWYVYAFNGDTVVVWGSGAGFAVLRGTVAKKNITIR